MSGKLMLSAIEAINEKTLDEDTLGKMIESLTLIAEKFSQFGEKIQEVAWNKLALMEARKKELVEAAEYEAERKRIEAAMSKMLEDAVVTGDETPKEA